MCHDEVSEAIAKTPTITNNYSQYTVRLGCKEEEDEEVIATRRPSNPKRTVFCGGNDHDSLTDYVKDLLVNHAVRNYQTPVVRSGGEQRIAFMERDSPDGRPVQPQRLIRFAAQIQVEPKHFTIVRRHQQVVAAGMDVYVGYPLGIRLQLFHEVLLREIVDTDVPLCGHEQKRTHRMELHALDQPLRL